MSNSFWDRMSGDNNSSCHLTRIPHVLNPDIHYLFLSLTICGKVILPILKIQKPWISKVRHLVLGHAAKWLRAWVLLKQVWLLNPSSATFCVT